MGGREVVRMRCLTREEQAILEGSGQPCPCLGLARRAQLYAPPMDDIRLQEVAASGRTADATSLPNRPVISADTNAKPAAGPSSSKMRAPSPPRNASMTGNPLGRIE